MCVRYCILKSITFHIDHYTVHICDQQLIDEKVKSDLKNMAKIVLEQNYSQFENKFYSKERGLAMGSPASFVFSEK